MSSRGDSGENASTYSRSAVAICLAPLPAASRTARSMRSWPYMAAPSRRSVTPSVKNTRASPGSSRTSTGLTLTSGNSPTAVPSRPTHDVSPSPRSSSGFSWPDRHSVGGERPAVVAFEQGRGDGRVAHVAGLLEQCGVEQFERARQRAAVAGHDPQDVAHDAGDRRGLRALAAHVADGDPQAVVGQLGRVVEVAADLGADHRARAGAGHAPRGRGQVLGGEGHPGDVRERARHERRLEFVGDGLAFGVDAGVVEGERTALGEVGDDGALLRGVLAFDVACPTVRTPMVAPRADSGTAMPSRPRGTGSSMPVQPSVASAAASAGAALSSFSRRCSSSDSSAWVRAASRRSPPSPVRCTAAQRPELGHDELRDECHREVLFERVGEEFAGLGEVGEPAGAALLVGAHPVDLDGQGDAFGDELGQRPPGGLGVAREEEPAAGRGGERQRDGDGDVADVAELGEDLRPGAVSGVVFDRAARGGRGVVAAGEQLGDDLVDRQPRLERGGDGEERGELVEVRQGHVDVGVRVGAGRGPGVGVAVDAEPDRLAGRVVGGAPRGREAVDEEEAAAALGGDLGHGGVEGVDAAGAVVGDGDAHADRVGGDGEVDVSAGVDDAVGGQLGREQEGLVEQLGETGFGEHRAHCGAGGGGGAVVGREPEAPGEPLGVGHRPSLCPSARSSRHRVAALGPVRDRVFDAVRSSCAAWERRAAAARWIDHRSAEPIGALAAVRLASRVVGGRWLIRALAAARPAPPMVDPRPHVCPARVAAVRGRQSIRALGSTQALSFAMDSRTVPVLTIGGSSIRGCNAPAVLHWYGLRGSVAVVHTCLPEPRLRTSVSFLSVTRGDRAQCPQ